MNIFNSSLYLNVIFYSSNYSWCKKPTFVTKFTLMSMFNFFDDIWYNISLSFSKQCIVELVFWIDQINFYFVLIINAMFKRGTKKKHSFPKLCNINIDQSMGTSCFKCYKAQRYFVRKCFESCISIVLKIIFCFCLFLKNRTYISCYMHMGVK